MKPLLSLVTVLVATAAATARPALTGRNPFADTDTRPHPAVVRVIVPDGTGMSLGSGALVAVSGNLGLVVTNWHVVRDAQGQIVVAFPDGFRSGATVIDVDRDWDLAALAIWRPNVEPIPLANEPPKPGEPLTIAGYGKGSYRAITGRCTQYVAPGQAFPFEMVELSAGAREGDSGGPIFNSRGELAGVLFGAAWGHTTGSYCGRVREFLASVSDDFGRLEAGSTMIAQRSQPAATPTARPWQPSPNAIARQPPPSADPIAQPSPPHPGGADSHTTGHTLPIVSIPARPWAAGQPSLSQPAAASPDAGWSRSLPPSGTPGEPATQQPTEPLRWEDIAGSTRTEQIKTVLAAVGLLAIFFHGLRLLGAGQES